MSGRGAAVDSQHGLEERKEVGYKISDEGERGERLGSYLPVIRELAQLLEKSELSEVLIETAEERVRVRRGQPLLPTMPQLPGIPPHVSHPVIPSSPEQVAQPPLQEAQALVEITSPFVGTFYRAPRPDAPPYVDVGSTIRPGQILCIIEAMKLMNEIEAEVAGTIVEICVQNGQPVEYGEVLFRVRPA